MIDDKGAIWTRNFTNLLISNGFFFAGFHMLLPTIPLLAAGMNGTKTQVGLIAGIFVLSSVITRLFTDVAINRFGARICLLAGIGLSLVSSLLYLLAPSVEALLWVRILHGVGFGVGTTFFIAVVSEFIPATRRGEGLGYFGLATTVAMAVAPATGLWIAGAYGFPVMFLCSAGCELVALVCLQGCAIPRLGRPRDVSFRMATRFGNAAEFLINIIFEKGTGLPALLTVLFGVGYGVVLNFIAVYAAEVGVANPGSFFIVGTVCIFVARLVMGKVYDRKGPAWVILPGAVVFAAGLLVLVGLSSATMLIEAAVLFGLGVGMLFPALQTGILSSVLAERRGAASATFSNALDVGLGGGSVLLGMFAESAGLSAAYLCAAATVAVLLTIYLSSLIHRRKAVHGLAGE